MSMCMYGTIARLNDQSEQNFAQKSNQAKFSNSSTFTPPLHSPPPKLCKTHLPSAFVRLGLVSLLQLLTAAGAHLQLYASKTFFFVFVVVVAGGGYGGA